MNDKFLPVYWTFLFEQFVRRTQYNECVCVCIYRIKFDTQLKQWSWWLGGRASGRALGWLVWNELDSIGLVWLGLNIIRESNSEQYFFCDPPLSLSLSLAPPQKRSIIRIWLSVVELYENPLIPTLLLASAFCSFARTNFSTIESIKIDMQRFIVRFVYFTC